MSDNDFYSFFKSNVDYFASLLGAPNQQARVFRQNTKLDTKRKLMPPTQTLTCEFDDLMEDLFSQQKFEVRYFNKNVKSVFGGEYLMSDDFRAFSQGYQFFDEGLSVDVQHPSNGEVEFNAELRVPSGDGICSAISASNSFSCSPFVIENVWKDMQVGLRVDSSSYSMGGSAIPGTQNPIKGYGFAQITDHFKVGVNVSYQAGRLIATQFDAILQCALSPLSHCTMKFNPHQREVELSQVHHILMDGHVRQLDVGSELILSRYGRRNMRAVIGAHIGDNIYTKMRITGNILSSTLAFRNLAQFCTIFNLTMHRDLQFGETTWALGLTIENNAQANAGKSSRTYRSAF